MKCNFFATACKSFPLAFLTSQRRSTFLILRDSHYKNSKRVSGTRRVLYSRFGRLVAKLPAAGLVWQTNLTFFYKRALFVEDYVWEKDSFVRVYVVCARAHTHPHTHSTHTPAHTCIHTHTHTHMHTHTNTTTCTHTHTYTHTNTQTHTHR